MMAKSFKEFVTESRHETDAGHYTIDKKGFNFNNSGHKHSISHKAMHHLENGGEHQGFKIDHDHPYHAPGVNHVIMNDDEQVEHHYDPKHIHKE